MQRFRVGLVFKNHRLCASLNPRLVSYKEEEGGNLSRAFAVKVDTKRHPVFLFSGVDLYHHFRNDAFYELYSPFTTF